MSEEQMRPNLLTVRPGNITIQNFVPGRIYKETLIIDNTCNVPIVINLKSSDKNKLSLSESKMRIGVNQSKKLDLIIQDKINIKYIKSEIKPKKLFIHINGDLIDVKYEINLIYYNRNQKGNNDRNLMNQNLIQNNQLNYIRNDIPNQYMIQNEYNELPPGYFNENLNNFINNKNINNPNKNLNKYNHNKNNNFPQQLNNNFIDDNEINQISNKSNEQYNNEQEIESLKDIINRQNEIIASLQSIIEQNNLNQNIINNNPNKSLLSISHNSLFFFGGNLEKGIKEKYKLDENIEKERILSKNKILELENSTLLTRIKCLEKKLSLYTFENNFNKENENANEIIDVDANLENNNDDNYINQEKEYNEENLMNENNNINLNMDMNMDINRYKYNYQNINKDNNIMLYKDMHSFPGKRKDMANYNINSKFNNINYNMNKDDSF